MSFDRLDDVMAIAEEQNMTKAAARLFISQPALTASINKLEEELGVKLFDRQRPPIKLTPAGVLYMKEMSRIHQLQFNLKAQLSSFARKKPQFTIGIGKGRSQFWLPILLPILQESHPEIQIIVKNGNYDTLENTFHSGSIDIAFGSLNFSFSDADIVEEPLSKENLIYIVPSKLGIIDDMEYGNCSLYNPFLISPSLLNEQPFVCAESGNSYQRYLEIEMNKYGFRPGDIFIYDFPPLAAQLAGRGMGIFFPSQNLCEWERLTLNSNVYFCTLNNIMPNQNIRVYYNRNSARLDLIHEVISIVRNHVIPALYSNTASIHEIQSQKADTL